MQAKHAIPYTHIVSRNLSFVGCSLVVYTSFPVYHPEPGDCCYRVAADRRGMWCGIIFGSPPHEDSLVTLFTNKLWLRSQTSSLLLFTASLGTYVEVCLLPTSSVALGALQVRRQQTCRTRLALLPLRVFPSLPQCLPSPQIHTERFAVVLCCIVAPFPSSVPSLASSSLSLLPL